MQFAKTYMAYRQLGLAEKRDLFEKFDRDLEAEKLVKIGVFGGFSSGKSSLIDALIGKKLLPTSVLPKTSKPAAILNSPSNRLTIRYANHLTDTIFLSEKGKTAEDICKEAIESISDLNAVLSYEVEYLFNTELPKVALIDTPGMNSVFEDHSVLSANLAPTFDVIILVLNAAQPLAQGDLEFLAKLNSAQVLFLVLNKVDLIDPMENSVQEILINISEKLRSSLPERDFFIYGVSSKIGNEEPENQFDMFRNKLWSIVTENFKKITEAKIENLLAEKWPTLETDYEKAIAELEAVRNSKKQKYKALAIGALFIILPIVGFFTYKSVRLSMSLDKLRSLHEPGKAEAIAYLRDYPDLLLVEIEKQLESPNPRAYQILSTLSVLKELPEILIRDYSKYLRILAGFPDRDIAGLSLELLGKAGVSAEDAITIAQGLETKDQDLHEIALIAAFKFYQKRTAFGDKIILALRKSCDRIVRPETTEVILGQLKSASSEELLKNCESLVLSCLRSADQKLRRSAFDLLMAKEYKSENLRKVLLDIIRKGTPEDSLASAESLIRRDFPEDANKIKLMNSGFTGVEDSISNPPPVQADKLRGLTVRAWASVDVVECLNLRKGPGLSYARLRCIPPKHSVYVQKNTNVRDTHENIESFWYKVKYYDDDGKKNVEGYVFGGYLKQ